MPFTAATARMTFLPRIALGRPLVEVFSRPLVVPAAAWPGMTCRRGPGPSNALLRVASFAITGSEHDFELIELIPLGVGALPVGDRQKFLQALTGGGWLRFVHSRIITRAYRRTTRRIKPTITPKISSFPLGRMTG